jgi:transcriptional regulator with XRE-family HTH domain
VAPSNDVLNRVQEAREARGLSREELAALIRTSRQHVWLIENGGIKWPSVDLARRLADALCTDIDTLFPAPPAARVVGPGSKRRRNVAA